MRIVVVDDDWQFRRQLQKVLPGETRTAATIGEGLQVARDWQPSVVVLDARLRRSSRDGIDALPDFRQVAPRAQLVVVTSDYLDDDAARAFRLGAFSYLEKGDDETLARIVLAARACSPSTSQPPPDSSQ